MYPKKYILIFLSLSNSTIEHTDQFELDILLGKPQYRQKEKSLKKLLIQKQTGATVAYTEKTILLLKYEPEKFEPTMDKNQPEYTQEK